MYILSVEMNDEHFKPGSKYRIIDDDGKYVTVIDEGGWEFHVSKGCTPMKDSRLKIINKKGNLSLF